MCSDLLATTKYASGLSGTVRSRRLARHDAQPSAETPLRDLDDEIVDNGQIHELWRSIKDLRHRCPGGFQSLLASLILLARTSALLTLEDHQHVDAARVPLVTHSRRPHQP